MNLLHVLILALVQGLTELLPVSSSAHVVVVGRFLGWDPSSPEGTFLLVMLHTGTMFAVLLYFWKRWRALLQESVGAGKRFLLLCAIATVATGVVGFALKAIIEKIFMAGMPKAEIEQLFKNLPAVAGALFSAGVLILIAGRYENRPTSAELGPRQAAWIGMIQGLCLPFRGFSRSGATISTGLILGVPKMRAEEFSFALAVILTPPVIVRYLHRLVESSGQGLSGYFSPALLMPGLVGMVFAFIGGLLALRWMSDWIDRGRWQYFGYYCLAFSLVVLGIHFSGAASPP
jgi:undecaprenyl-diphosphatase